MAYSQEISRAHPGCVLVLVDQTAATWCRTAGADGRPVAAALAEVVNRTLDDLLTTCERGEDRPRHWFDVGLVGYADDGGRAVVGPAWGGGLAGRELAGIPALYDHPLGIDTRTRVEFHDDGAGGIIEVPIEVRMPVWYRPPPPADEVGRALLRTALGGPPDPTPWLVYADWLDDRGDPRAGVIRGELPPAADRWGRPLPEALRDPGPAVERLRDWLNPNWDAGPYAVWDGSPADTPLAAGLGRARELVAGWIVDHPDGFPPVVLHLTAGPPVGADAVDQADRLKSLATTDGNVLLLNTYLSPTGAEPAALPTGTWQPPDQPSRDLFWLSSLAPDPFRTSRERRGLEAPAGCRLLAVDEDLRFLQFFWHRGLPPVSNLPRHLR